ncbi:MAG: O-antigen ligase family protein [Calditrichaeota bacterium]|nr:O-antigen ligase family protein [Calditrichota bacterium]
MAISVFGLGLVALIMTGSRGGWIAFILGMLVFFFIAVKSRHVRLSTLFGTGLIGIAVIAGIALAFSGMIEERIHGNDYGSAISRIPMIQIAINLIEAHPLGGVGINNYAVVMKKYNDTILGRRFKSIPRPVHNMFLLVTGETGMIGLLMLLLLLYFFFATALKSARSSDETISIINISVLAGIVAMCAHGMVDKHAPGGYPLFYVFMAMIASAYFLNGHLSHNDLSQPMDAGDEEIERPK